MEEINCLWKRKSSERNPSDSETSGSLSSHSERCFDEDQEMLTVYPNHHLQSPEVASHAISSYEETNDSVKRPTEKLSAGFSDKDDLVKQHAKVAEEAVAGWEKAENEVAILKQQLDSTIQQNSALKDQLSHLDGALKECVRQLRQSREDQEQKVQQAVLNKTNELESAKTKIESDLHRKIDSLERENSALKLDLLSLSKDLEVITIERDLSIQAAETASKQHLESIKKVAKLEAESRKLKATAHKPYNQSDIGVDPSCSDSWASALIAELDQFKNNKGCNENKSVEIDIMDDFLEMERLASLPVPEAISKQDFNGESALKAELESMTEKLVKLEKEKAELEEKLEKMNRVLIEKLDKVEEEKAELEEKLEKMDSDLITANESKKILECQLIGVEADSRTLAAEVESLRAEVEKERDLSETLAVKCNELEDELTRKKGLEARKIGTSNGELKIKQGELALAAGKLAECQKTIASLGNQLQSLSTLEEFLVEAPALPEFSGADGESWKLHSNVTFWPKLGSVDSSKVNGESSSLLRDYSDRESIATSSSSSNSSGGSGNSSGSVKSRNGFAKLFSRSKSGIQIQNQLGN